MKILTSYFAKIPKMDRRISEPISIARFTPKWYIGEKCLELAPSAETLLAYKEDGDWEKFKSRYLEELRHVNPHEVHRKLEKLGRGKNVVLVCFEKEYFECHRSICAKWLKEKLGVSVQELNL